SISGPGRGGDAYKRRLFPKVVRIAGRGRKERGSSGLQTSVKRREAATTCVEVSRPRAFSAPEHFDNYGEDGPIDWVDLRREGGQGSQYEADALGPFDPL
ncbi:hypothetical protein CCMA1212_008376, partial [Trichoderma ghanense]